MKLRFTLRAVFRRAFVSLVATASLAAAATPVNSFDEIEFWTGTGSHQSALILQWNFALASGGYESHAYAWGFRWEDGDDLTTWDMLQAIDAADPRLSVVLHPDFDSVFGIFYDVTGNGGTFEPGSPGVADAWPNPPLVNDTPGSVSDPGDLYQNGWASLGYWSYNLAVTPSEIYPGTSETLWTYALEGPAGRILTHHSWDVFSFVPDLTWSIPLPDYVPPVAAVPEPSTVAIFAFLTALIAAHTATHGIRRRWPTTK